MAHPLSIDMSKEPRYSRHSPFRIEDNILITKDGYINLTGAIKDPDEMEKIILGS